MEPSSPPADGPALSLSPAERKLLVHLRSATAPHSEEEVAAATGLAAEAVRGGLQRLRSKRLTVVDEQHAERLVLTKRGEDGLARGLPERRLLQRLQALGRPADAGELAGGELDAEELPVAIGVLRRRRLLAEGSPFALQPGSESAAAELPEERALAAARDGAAVAPEESSTLKRRGLLAVERSTTRRWSPSEEGGRLPLGDGSRPEEGALRPERLRDGSWREVEFRPYDVRAPVPYVQGPAPHPYLAFLEEFAELLVGLGFAEEEGPLLETEFWNNDVLFMPQEHPARSVHDVFSVRGVEGRLPDAHLLLGVAAAHEGRPLSGTSEPLSVGWRSPFNPEISRRPVLRSQTTSVSARFLASRPRPPFRRYCIGRSFRPDAVDARHHVEFDQCEGILGEEGTSMRELVGMFQALAEGIGIRELRIRPSYFPFTEPSVEGYVRHPSLGWMEVLPGGLFRPEVLRPLGVEVPVAAWGVGLTRLAMVALGVNDIRELFDADLDRLRGGD
ncbi:MAG: phenylalanine--tRNA ligase subunit alpha [Thermoplasmata archaeon]|nr:phenylalanine--tRNA ligase subunit alpha [Thermoplasmata archaeon]